MIRKDDHMDTINVINVGGIDKEIEDTFARTRIDEIIAPSGGAPSAEEILDARVGYDNTTYNSLGLAIRTQVGNLANYMDSNIGHSSSNSINPLPSETGAGFEVPIVINPGEKYNIKVDFEGTPNRTYILWAYYNDTWHQVTLTDGDLVTNREYTMVYNEPYACSDFRVMFYSGEARKATCTISVLGDIYNDIEEINDRLFGITEAVASNPLGPDQGVTIRIPIAIQPGQLVKIKTEYNGSPNRTYNVWAHYNGSDHHLSFPADFLTNKEYIWQYTEESACSAIIFMYYAGEAANAIGKVSIIGEVYRDRITTVHVGKNREFTTIQDALDNVPDSENNPITIYIDPGVYEPFSSTALRYISLIGSGKETTIVKSTSGHYDYPAANFRTNGLIFGIGFEMRATEPNQKPGTPYAYAFHSDWGTCKMEIVDCSFYSNAGPAIGLGLHDHERLMFKNCDFVTEVDGTYGSNLGAFYCHSSFTPNSVEQYLEVRNCIAENRRMTNGFSIDVLESVAGCTYEAVMIGNGTYDINGNGGHIDAAFLSSKSFGNNNPAFNAS